jgi:hypothetical protein
MALLSLQEDTARIAKTNLWQTKCRWSGRGDEAPFAKTKSKKEMTESAGSTGPFN